MNASKTKTQHIDEFLQLRQRIAQLEALETKHKYAEKVLQESEKQYRSLVERANDGICIIQEGMIQYLNPRLVKIWGGTSAEIIGTSFIGYIDTDSLLEVKDRYAKHILGIHVPSTYEAVVRDKYGNKITVEINGALITYNEKPADLVIIRDITERKQMENALKSAEKKYRTVARLSADFSYSCINTGDDGYKVDWVTDVFFTLSGYSEAELHEQGCWLFVSHPDDLEMATKSLRELKAGESDTREFRIVTRDGRVLNIINYVECQADPDAPGGLRLFGTVQNITKRKHGEEELLFKSQVLDNASDMILLHESNPGTQVLYVNEITCQLLGYSNKELLDMKMSEIVSPEIKISRDYKERATSNNLRSQFESIWVRKDGSTIPVSVNRRRYQYNDRQLVLASAHDITFRKQAEDKLKLDAGILASTSDSIIVHDLDGNMVYLNETAYKSLGYTREELMSKNIRQVDVDSTEQPRSQRNEMMEKGSVVFETAHLHANGNRIPVEVNAKVIESGGKKLILGVVRDITERKQAEAKLQESEEQYRAIFENAVEGIFQSTSDGKFLKVNPALAFLYGFNSPQEMITAITDIGQQLYANPEDRVRFKTLLEKYGFVKGFESEQRHNNGHKMWISINAKAIKGEGGNILYYDGILQDITQRRRAEEELKLRSQLLDSASDAIFLHDFEGNPVFVNEMAYKSLGYTREELMSMNIRQIDSSQHADAVNAEMRNLVENGSITFETAHRHKNEALIPVEVNARVIESGGKELILGVVRDITERKKTEEELRLKSELVDNATDAIFLHDLDGNIVFANEAASNSFGYSREELMSMSIIQLGVTERAKTFETVQQKLLEKDTRIFETTNKCKDGSLIPVEVNARVIESGGRKLILGVIRDITERKQAEEKLKQSYEELKAAMDGTIEAIASMAETRDPYTAGHQRRVAKLASAIAEELNLPKEQIEMIRVAGTLHDIGKVSVPAEILAKPGKLNELEIGMIRMHPQVGREILKTLKLPWPICPIVLQHHERMDGSGYPKGMSGEDISLEARILAVADVVEAMASHRPYRPTVGIDKALEEILKNRGILYDTKVVDACLKLFAEKAFKFE